MLPQKNAKGYVYGPHPVITDNGTHVDYFEGDFSPVVAGDQLESTDELPTVNWTQYKVVELLRWNAFEMCLNRSVAKLMGIPVPQESDVSSFSLGFSNTSTARRYELPVHNLVHCTEQVLDQRDTDKLRDAAFSGDRADKWMTFVYEQCTLPSETQSCVDAVVKHISVSAADNLSVRLSEQPTSRFDTASARWSKQVDSEHVHKTRRNQWSHVTNAEQISAALVHAGFATYLQPIYCFAWEADTGADDIAKYMALLPQHYILPGSSTDGSFNETAFRDGIDEADVRSHSLIAFARGAGSTWIQALRLATTRPIVLLDYVSEVIPDRIVRFVAFSKRNPNLNDPTVDNGRFSGPAWNSIESWLESEAYPEEAQLQRMHNLNQTYRKLPAKTIWRLRNTSAIATGHRNATHTFASVYMGPVGVASDPQASLCVFSAMTSLPIPYESYVQRDTSTSFVADMNITANLTTANFSRIFKEAREFAYVKEALQAFKTLAEHYGCGAAKSARTRHLGSGPSDLGAWRNSTVELP